MLEEAGEARRRELDVLDGDGLAHRGAQPLQPMHPTAAGDPEQLRDCGVRVDRRGGQDLGARPPLRLRHVAREAPDTEAQTRLRDEGAAPRVPVEIPLQRQCLESVASGHAADAVPLAQRALGGDEAVRGQAARPRSGSGGARRAKDTAGSSVPVCVVCSPPSPPGQAARGPNRGRTARYRRAAGRGKRTTGVHGTYQPALSFAGRRGGDPKGSGAFLSAVPPAGQR